MRILVACEESQIVTVCFRALGHEAFSCDVLATSGTHPEWHIKDNVLRHLDDGWDMMVGFPPCTDLCASGARWFAEKRADGRQGAAVGFFMRLAFANIPRVAIENPVGVMSTLFRRPDQIIHPWQFGHAEEKSTCLWLFGLPKLVPESDVRNLMRGKPRRERERIHYMPASKDRGFLRSKTYVGVAIAMANQWGRAGGLGNIGIY